MKIVVVGSQGTLGSELVRNWNSPKVAARIADNLGRSFDASQDVIAPLNLPDFDICSRMIVLDAMAELAPDVIVNAAGVNLVDWLEPRPNTARNIHEHGVANLREAARRQNALLVQFGCAEVFYRSRLQECASDKRERAATPEEARRRARPFATEEDAPIASDAPGFAEFAIPNPASVYAKTKLESERVASEAPKSLIVRFSSVFGETTPYSSGNLIASALNAFRRATRVSALNDKLIEPLWTIDLLCALKTLLRVEVRGTWHIGGASRGTPAEIVEFLLKQTGLRGREVVGISSADYGFQAPQSAFTILSSERAKGRGDLYTPPDWRRALQDYFDFRQRGLNF